MQNHIINQTKPVHVNSYVNADSPSLESSTKRTYVSPKDYQKRKSSTTMGQSIHMSSTQKRRKVTKPKKIILGKPCTGKQKMNLEELKALSRQVRPNHTTVSLSPLTNLNCRSTLNHHEENIILLSRNLRENLFRAKSRMMDSLKNSNEPQALQIYKDLMNQSSTTTSTSDNSSRISSESTSHSEDEDDCSSVSTLSSLQLRLVTDESGHVFVVSSDYPTPSSKVSIPSTFDMDIKQENNPLFHIQDPITITTPTTTTTTTTSSSFMSLYTPHDYPSMMLDMELFLSNHPYWTLLEKSNDYSQSTTTTTTTTTTPDVTEEQINSWLQRGGHNDTITMATDQELAALLDFDDM